MFIGLYKKLLLKRYDKDGIIPYYSYKDFLGLNVEEHHFVNSKNINIAYFIYNYSYYKDDKVIIFCHGIGPGHTAYLAEINMLTKAGFRVIALDYTGCDCSGGDSMISINEPTRDIIDLINHLKLKQEIVFVGHSLGAYSIINVLRCQNIKSKAVVISPFINLEDQIKVFVKSKMVTKSILKYEAKIEPDYFIKDFLEYLKTTDNKMLFIQSKDDNIVPFEKNLKVVEELNNPNIQCLILDKRGHNPNYTEEAVAYMNKTFIEYNSLVKKKKLKTVEEKKNYFKDKSINKMTEQDEEVFKDIIEFIQK